jgi:hypothetical protein
MAIIVARLEAIGNHDEIRSYQLFITFASRPRPRYLSRPVAHDHDRGGGYELMRVVPMTRLFNLPDGSDYGIDQRSPRAYARLASGRAVQWPASLWSS